jgi:hypothetical protein
MTLVVNAADLIMALESRNGDMAWYLDLTTGDVLPMSVENALDDEAAELSLLLDDHPERFLPIEPIGSNEGFRIMELFVESLLAGLPAERLRTALGQQRPFRRFKDELLAWPELRERWFRFHHACMREHAAEWIMANGLEVELTDQHGPVSDV